MKKRRSVLWQLIEQKIAAYRASTYHRLDELSPGREGLCGWSKDVGSLKRSRKCSAVSPAGLEQKGLLTTSPLITSWQVLIADEAARRAMYKVRCQLLRPAYRLEIRLIQTEADLLYSYQLFTDYPILRWDNAPHCPSLRCFPHHQHEES